MSKRLNGNCEAGGACKQCGKNHLPVVVECRNCKVIQRQYTNTPCACTRCGKSIETTTNAAGAIIDDT